VKKEKRGAFLLSRINKTGFIILGMLSIKPMTGYDMKKAFEGSASFLWNISLGQIYPGLRKLEKDGLVTKRVELDESRVKARKTYSLTEEGRNILKWWLAEPVEEEQLRHEVLLKVFFGNLVPVLDTTYAVEDFRSKTSNYLRELDNAAASIRNYQNEAKDSIELSQYQQLAFLFSQHIYRACLAWSDEAIIILGNMRGKETENSKRSSHQEGKRSSAEVMEQR
jgi:DNA-binding PadR family transcriptional regulator